MSHKLAISIRIDAFKELFTFCINILLLTCYNGFITTCIYPHIRKRKEGGRKRMTTSECDV